MSDPIDLGLALPDDLPGTVAPDQEPEKDPTLDAWLEERKTILGGTDASAILGYNPWRSAWDVWAEKRGIIEPQASSERMEIGSELEEPVARLYARRTGRRIRRTNEVMRDRELPFLGGHPDRLVVGEKRGVEVKTVDGAMVKEWSKPGEPLRVPKAYYIQVQHYLMISGYAEWDLAALLGLQRLRVYPITRNEVVIRAMREKLRAFWERCIMGDEVPDPEPTEQAKAWLKATYPTHDPDLLLVANPEQEELIAEWLEAREREKVAKERAEKLRIRLAAAMGSAAAIRYSGGLITYRKDRDSTALHTDWEGVALWLAEQHGLAIPAEEIMKRTQTVVTREGARKMLPRKGA